MKNIHHIIQNLRNAEKTLREVWKCLTLIFLIAKSNRRGYFPEVFQDIGTYFSEVFCEILVYFLEVVKMAMFQKAPMHQPTKGWCGHHGGRILSTALSKACAQPLQLSCISWYFTSELLDPAGSICNISEPDTKICKHTTYSGSQAITDDPLQMLEHGGGGVSHAQRTALWAPTRNPAPC